MRAARIIDASSVETRTMADPTPEDTAVVVRVEAAAICGSDLHFLYRPAGEKPWIPGHEAAGTVVAVDRPSRLKVGDRVCLSAFRACGDCEMCRAGYVAYCAHKSSYGFNDHGAHAELVRVEERCLLPLPDAVSFEEGCLILDPVGTPFHALKRMATNATHTVLVTGLGPMGLGAVLVAAHLGARVIAVDPVVYRRDLALKLGAWKAIDSGAGDLCGQVRDATSGRGVDRAVECAGRAECLEAGMELVRPLGHVAIIGSTPKAVVRPLDHFIPKGITLSGSCCFPLGEYDEILRLFPAGLRVRDLITHRYGIERAAEAYRTFADGNTGKVLIVASGGLR